jgi:hypothetical protein
VREGRKVREESEEREEKKAETDKMTIERKRLKEKDQKNEQ